MRPAYHVCFGPENDVRVSEIWDSREQFQAFGERLMPLLAELGIRPGEPEVYRSTPASGEEDVSMGTAENKAVQRRIVEEVINQRNLDLADELFSGEHELHPGTSGVGRGPEGMKRAFAGLHEEFPDIEVTIESMVAEGDIVAVRLTFSGTHAATGDRATWPEMVFTRFSGGKAAESWEVTDTGRSWSSPPW